MKTIIIIITIFIKIILNALEYVPITFETTQLFLYYIFGMNLSMLVSWASTKYLNEFKLNKIATKSFYIYSLVKHKHVNKFHMGSHSND